jgi:hypothetical protein
MHVSTLVHVGKAHQELSQVALDLGEGEAMLTQQPREVVLIVRKHKDALVVRCNAMNAETGGCK